ncbi:MAG: hypothetical protein AAF433_22755 [Bacteroidota bacterium]
MNTTTFWRGLIITTLLSLILSFGLHSIDRLRPHWPLTVIAIVLFILLSLAMYYLGDRTAKATNRHLFTSVTMGFTFLKMMASAGLILVYALLFEPADKLFVLPFFLIYLLYSAFELIFMIKLARQPGNNKVGEGE